MKWLGIKSSDLVGISTNESNQLITLSERDRRLAISMLHRFIVHHELKDFDMKKELQCMLVLNCKAEIQLVESLEGGLSEWLTTIDLLK
jgi:hypothetical protein